MRRLSPFPGMDPWLEKSWGDIHSRLITYISDRLNDVLPDPLAARTEERVFVESPMDEGRQFVPDVRVIEFPRVRRGATLTSPAAASGDPQMVLLDFEPIEITETYVEIRDFGSDARVITLIELVSMSNKTSGEGREKYLQKQREAIAAGVNIVEIDLLRGGRSVTLADQRVAPERRRGHYHASIHRVARPRKVEFYPISLRHSLPKLHIPLRAADPDVELDLQGLVEQAYRAGRYHLSIDYTHPPEPPLPTEDQQWAADLLATGRPS